MIQMKIESKIDRFTELPSWDPPQKQDYEISSFDQFRYSIKFFLESWNLSDHLIQTFTYLFEFLMNFFNIKRIINSFGL